MRRRLWIPVQFCTRPARLGKCGFRRGSYGSFRYSSTEARQWSTPLARNLAEAIKTTGPIPLASYMRQCLTSPHGGYYTSSQDGHDQFGRKGDFITSPEISQIFGELIGVWIVAEWMAQGQKSRGVELIEVGPGRGTLMDDVLRTMRNFKPLASSIETIYMVEASSSLREAQERLLCGDTSVGEDKEGFKSTSKTLGVPMVWAEDIRFVPKGKLSKPNRMATANIKTHSNFFKDPSKSPFIIAHEFFDALPIHAFQSVPPSQPTLITSTTIPPPRTSTTPQWRELLVTPTPLNSTHTTLSTPRSQRHTGAPPEFQLSLAKASTPHSLLLPETSQRYKALKSRPGATIEICPEGQSYASEFARRIGGDAGKSASGAALILDYGPASTIPVNSLRGIRAHKTVSPFSYPGLVDLSADVDFTALAEAALSASSTVEVHGPIEQGSFLQAMGIRERAEQLLMGVQKGDDEKKERLEGGWRRLVERGVGGMGKVYKAMAIVPLSGGKKRPVGFGGDVEV
ncbi:hypothetical protein FGG08_002789 [Glutinoglossum americanum]|uniref:Protein arginine methyltransferase NDUFAF7 n=1 Tax=Glutinoglossum americanum TaxID=1670608 RepID=A0A9P8I8J0_9PEZI|nr:hypothetical protein FGG08_002789 [Glutinoglossum americanum]